MVIKFQIPNVFHSARIKLTLWYIIISMVVSILFSITLFSFFHRELERNGARFELRVQRMRDLSPDFQPEFPPPSIDFEASENNIKLNLFVVNGIIFVIASLAGYFLAGRTLQPIEEMLEKQNRFIADASHELRTPLTALKTAIEVSLRDKNLNLQEAKNILHDNLEDIDQLELLSNNLLSITKLQSNIPLITEIVSMKDAIKTAIKTINSLAQQKDISIISKGTDSFVKADKNRLSDVLVIFLDNAIKYSPTHTTINIHSKFSNNKALITIHDEGIGIDKNDITHIFERFYRASKSRSKDMRGNGLGLSIAKEIVELYRGTIRVESKRNKGTTFTLEFPATEYNI